MKAKLLNAIVRAGGNPVLPAKETETLDALAPVFPFCTGVRYPKRGNLWTEVKGERRIRKWFVEEVGSMFTLLVLVYYFLPCYLKMGAMT